MNERYKVEEDSLGYLMLYDSEDEKYIIADSMLSAGSYIEEICGLLNEKQEQINSQFYVIKEYQKRNEELFKENQRKETVIRESVQLERTCIGKSVLRQLAEALGIEL